MLSQTIISAILLVLLVSVPNLASALEVQISVAGGLPVTQTFSSATGATGPPRTTTLLFDPVTLTGGFQVTCSNCSLDGGNKWKVIASQSGSVTKISVANTRIITPDPLPTNPSLRIIAFSGTTVLSGTTTKRQDFRAVSAGGRPAGVVMTGNFTAGPLSFGPAGDTISATGIVQSTAAITAKNFVNQTAGPNPPNSADTEKSLPSFCTGDPACTFTASAGTTTFFDEIVETVQITCGSTTCRPKMTLHVNVAFASGNGGDMVDLPNSVGFTVYPTPQDAIEDSPAFDAFKAALQISVQSPKFAFESALTLGAGSEGIDPTRQALSLDLGSEFSTTIAAFKKRGSGLWEFKGIVNNVSLAAFIKQLDGTGQKFAVVIGGSGADLSGITGPIVVRLTIGEETGRRLVTPRFF